jgi:SAM-dependent methyltransferase
LRRSNNQANTAQERNRQAWDDRVRRRDWYIDSATEQDFKNPLVVIDPCGWLGGDVTGKHLLCLAAGGGRHSLLFAAAGARVTVLDISPKMLELDRKIAMQRNLEMRIVEGSMDDLSMLEPESFDIVVQPVSTCYVPDLVATYREVARVTAPDALYISQHKQPGTLQADLLPAGRGYVVSEPYYRTAPLPEMLTECQHREAGTMEYLHRWQDLLGGLCRAGFVIEDLVEPRHANPTAESGSFGHRSCYLPPFVTVKARRISADLTTQNKPRLWIP